MGNLNIAGTLYPNYNGSDVDQITLKHGENQ